MKYTKTFTIPFQPQWIYKGLPSKHRPVLWKFLVTNDLKISKAYSKHLLNQALEKPINPRALIGLDLKRSFHHLWACNNFSSLLVEAEIVLQMWEVG